MSDIASEVRIPTERLPLGERIPPHLYFVGSAIFHYLGPSFAVMLFAVVAVPGVAWLRVVSAGLVFAIWRRPWRAFLAASSRTRWLIVALGAIFGLMNYTFYIAIDRLPLGTVAAVEFVGPVALALVGTRTRRNLIALAVAVTGVYLLADVRFAGDPGAFGWAFANMVLFTMYIVVAHAVSRADPDTTPVDRLGAAMLIAMVVITPLGLGDALPAFGNWLLLAAGVGVGVSSSVIPYVFDQLAMTQLARSTYALFVALLPATAVIIGLLVLHQVPTAVEVVGVGAVVAGVAIHREH